MWTMKRLAAISAILASLTLPVFAQHGGGHAGGGGGFSGHAGGGVSGGFRSAPSSPTPRSGFAPRPAGFARPGYHGRPDLGPRSSSGPGMQTTTVSPYRQAYRSPNGPENRRWNHGGIVYERRDPQAHAYRHGDHSAYFVPYYWALPYSSGFYGLGFNSGDGYFDNSLEYDSDQSYGPGDDPGDYYGPDQYNGFDPQGNDPGSPSESEGYSVQGQRESQDQYQDRASVDGPAPGQYPNQVPPGAAYQPVYGAQNLHASPGSASNQRPARPVYRQSSSVPSQPAVTLVFKDGRANQIIHNYLINGGTLTVWDQSAHDIPIEDLNLEATRKLNRDQGVDFLLPRANH